MPPPADIDPDRLRQLHAQGLSCAAIAAELGVNRSTISRHARRLGLKFDRAQTQAATEALVVDAKAKRAQLANDLLDDAARIRAQLWEPALVYSFGGKDNTYAEMWHDKPDFTSQLKIVQAAKAALDGVLRIEAHDADTQGLAAVDAWLRDMIGD
jgi:hypothetical protein